MHRSTLTPEELAKRAGENMRQTGNEGVPPSNPSPG